MRIKDSINNILHPILLRYQDRQFVKKNTLVRRQHPGLFKSSGLAQIDAHKKLWGQVKLRGQVDPSWFIMHSNLSGVEDIRYVPENVYFPYIEPILNDMEFAPSIADKNRLGEFMPKENIPKVVLRYIRGDFLAEDFTWLSPSVAQEILDAHEELVIKPSTDSSGGSGVRLWRRKKDGRLTVEEILRYREIPLIIQRKIIQHKQSAVFNSNSVNTCRVMTLRCPWDGNVVHLKTMLRIGRGDTLCDNMMMGGLCVGVRDDGRLAKYAYDYNGDRFELMPGTDMRFEGMALPLYPKMLEFAKNVAKRIPYMNILSFDLVADESENIVCLELNTAGQGITQLQYDGIPLFHKYTDDVIAYCKTHLDFNKYRHFRTFYW